MVGTRNRDRNKARLRTRARREERTDVERRIQRLRRPAQHRHRVDRWATADEDPTKGPASPRTKARLAECQGECASRICGLDPT